MSIHDGHRERMRDRFMEEGLDSFTDIQALEFLLFYAIPRKDTNELAHGLLEKYGSFSQVLDAPVEELAKFPGLSKHSASLLALIKQASRYYEVERAMQVKKLPTLSACGAYLAPFFSGRNNETVFLLCLDAQRKVLTCREIGEGTVNSAGVPIRRIVETALAFKASSVVLAHNHPSGIAVPSVEDQATTQRLAVALDAVDIVLADHIIVADGDYVSMVQSERYRHCFTY